MTQNRETMPISEWTVGCWVLNNIEDPQRKSNRIVEQIETLNVSVFQDSFKKRKPSNGRIQKMGKYP